MKIFLISNMFPSNEDKTYGVFVKNFCDGFANFGNFSFVYAVIKGRHKHWLLKLFKYIKFYVEIILKGILSKYDIIYVHYISHSSLPLLFLQIFKKKKVILNVHGDDILVRSLLTKFFLPFVKLILKKSDLIIVPSAFFEKLLIVNFNIANSKIFISASGGVDTNLFSVLPNRAKIKLPNITIGYVSRIDNGKGWRLFLTLVERIVKDGAYNVKAIIAGSGSESAELNKEITRLKLSNYISYKGAVLYTDLPKLFGQFDVFVFPSELPESLGLVGIEAMSCGVPVLGSDFAGIKTFVKSEYNGMLFKVGSVNSLYENFEKLMSLDLATLSQNARKTAKMYDSSKVYNELIMKIKQL
jgi:glycosyltransferase involved in cell wall biosynthesis